MKTYNWQQSDWPHFTYDESCFNEALYAIAEKTGLVSGKLTHVSQSQLLETKISLLVEEAVKTSEIEGEFISRLDVRSSIKNKLGLNPKQERIYDKRAQGVVDMMLDVRETYHESLTDEKLFDWHLMLLSSSTNPHLRIGTWRTHEDPMQVVSGAYGRTVVHFEAPPSNRVPEEMKQFIQWFNDTAPGKKKAIPYAPVRAAISHLYFESIHPFEDGNGRIGRAIAEKALSQGVGYPVLLSLSQIIERDKNAYYAALKAASRNNEITEWIDYFISVVLKAQLEVDAQITFIVKKSAFFEKFKNDLNDRELKVIKRMLAEGTEGFEGGMSAKKYGAITKISKATATRDLQHLHALGAFTQLGSGRNVRYELNLT